MRINYASLPCLDFALLGAQNSISGKRILGQESELEHSLIESYKPPAVCSFTYHDAPSHHITLRVSQAFRHAHQYFSRRQNLHRSRDTKNENSPLLGKIRNKHTTNSGNLEITGLRVIRIRRSQSSLIVRPGFH